MLHQNEPCPLAWAAFPSEGSLKWNLQPLWGDSEPQSPWRETENSSLQLLALGLALHFHVCWQISAGSNLFCKARNSRETSELATSVSQRDSGAVSTGQFTNTA